MRVAFAKFLSGGATQGEGFAFIERADEADTGDGVQDFSHPGLNALALLELHGDGGGGHGRGGAGQRRHDCGGLRHVGIGEGRPCARRLGVAIGLPAAAVLTMAQPNSRAEEDIARQVFETVKLPMVPAVIHRFKVHRDASREGVTAFEIDADGKAAAELQALWEWVSAQLQLNTSAVVHKSA